MYSSRRTSLFSGLAILTFVASVTFGQAPANDIVAPNGSARFFAATPVDLTQVPTQPVNSSPSGLTLSMPPAGADPNAIFNSKSGASGAGTSGTQDQNHGNPHPGNNGGTISGLTTVPTFAGAFAGQAGISSGDVFPYIMLGNQPLLGGTTTISAHIVEVSLQLLNANGSTFRAVPYAAFEAPTLNSPNFEEAHYSSSPSPTQFADAVQRAEFFPNLVPGPPWHTILTPNVVDRVTLTIPRFVNIQFPDGTIRTIQAYYAGTAPDGSIFVEMLDLLFNSLNTNLVANEINAGNFSPDALSLNLYPNTFLFSIDLTGNPVSCCVLGFHTYFFESGVVPQPRWLFEFASWISPGVFGPGFQDVTGLSHEISETFSNPFLNNLTPVWQFPGVPANAKICQGNLETADPVEVLADAPFPVTLTVGGKPFTFHPQNEALLQWFEMGTTSDAFGGAFSYPDTTVLPHSAVPCPQ
jgi:hypothetical protein